MVANLPTTLVYYTLISQLPMTIVEASTVESEIVQLILLLLKSLLIKISVLPHRARLIALGTSMSLWLLKSFKNSTTM